MENLTIEIGWEWALGIVGLLILIAWKGSARFTALETSMQWVKDTLHDLKVSAENATAPTATKIPHFISFPFPISNVPRFSHTLHSQRQPAFRRFNAHPAPPRARTPSRAPRAGTPGSAPAAQ